MSRFEAIKRSLVRQAYLDAKKDGVTLPESLIYGKPVKLVYSEIFNRTVFE